jgi:ABC-2 type transport system ATP-binding protein
MLLGLIRAGEGTAHVFDHPISRPSAYDHRVGALVENPAFVPGLSARSNLLSLARLRGLPTARVEEVLGVVGLAGRDSEPVKRFSLGMKQRLGIAAALLSDPELLILDEPTNGLDPAGIVEIRALLMDLGRSGRTVVVSSHLLAEIEAACDYIVIIRFGQLMFAGPTEELLTQTSAHIDLRPERLGDLGPLLDGLHAQGWRGERMGDFLRMHVEPGRAGDLNRAATAAGFTLAHLVVGQDSLEDIFLEMTGHSDGELAAGRAAAATRVTAEEVA